MRSVSLRLCDLQKSVIPIGFVDENLHTRVMIDCKKMFDEYPSAIPTLVVSPPTGSAYPAVVTRDGDFIVWDITASDAASDGNGEIQLTFTAGETVAKSYIGRIRVTRSLAANGEIPDPIQNWIDQANDILDSIPGTIDTALQEAKDSGEFDGPEGPAGADGQPGADGYSPTASVSKSGKTATITITDKNGTTTAQISDGEDADPTSIIDDTAGAGDTNKVWSADKSNNLLNEIDDKQDAPATAGTAGQVLGLDSNLDPVWVNQQGGGGGAVNDVQINGTSILSNGVANVPIASTNDFGVAKIQTSYGINVDNGKLFIIRAAAAHIKAGSGNFQPICPADQHISAFYGLAKASGDSTQSASNNSVGTYTEDAKSKISDMLNAPETVSGTTPSITAKAGVRYICGEVSTLTIVAPASGCIDVTFQSGSTPTILTVSSAKTGVTAIKWANGFDPSSLDADTTYEINILDGEFGVVGSWT